MNVNSPAITRRKPTARSRTTNGKVLVEGIDGRSATARRLHDIIADLSAELGDDLGQAEQLQVRTVASLVLHAERLTADMVNGKPVDSEEITRVSNSAARLLNSLKRQSKGRKARAPTVREQQLARFRAETAA
jgi:hypothetical protein